MAVNVRFGVRKQFDVSVTEHTGNSLAAYPTSSTVLKTSGIGDNLAEFNQFPCFW
jgi:hypothetical protein